MFNTLNNEMHVPSEVMEEAEQKIKSTTWMILINRLFFYRATTVMADLSNINFEVMDEMVCHVSGGVFEGQMSDISEIENLLDHMIQKRVKNT